MSEEGIKLCREYLVSHYLPGDAYRYEKHEALCNYYNIDHDVSRNITDNLDKLIGYDAGEDILGQDLDALSIKLDKVLRESKGE